MRHETYDTNGNLIAVGEILGLALRLSPIEIIELFTPQELASIEGSTNLQVIVFRTSLFAATNAILLDDARFTGAIALFQSLGILSNDRASKILTGQKP